MKHNSPGCATADCCGCWACETPVALVVVGAECCVGMDGTYLFGTGDFPSIEAACGTANAVSEALIVFRDSAVTIDGSGNTSCCFQLIPVFSFSAIAVCDSHTVTNGGTPSRSACHWLVLSSAAISGYVYNDAGTPTAFAQVVHRYRWYANRPIGVGIGCENALAEPFYEWEYTDLYESVFDCEDPDAPLTFVSRTLTDATDAAYTDADDDGFSWGTNAYVVPDPPFYRYDVCDPLTITLQF